MSKIHVFVQYFPFFTCGTGGNTIPIRRAFHNFNPQDSQVATAQFIKDINFFS